MASFSSIVFVLYGPLKFFCLLSDLDYRTTFFRAIRLLEYQFLDWRMSKTIELWDVGIKTQNHRTIGCRILETIRCPALIIIINPNVKATLLSSRTSELPKPSAFIIDSVLYTGKRVWDAP
jgi:hypothetical protein